jgi:SPP1 family predicted phage head-tail adaptor
MRQRKRGLSSGELDQRVTLERHGMTGSGPNATPGWTAQGTFWARVEALRGQERVIADRQAGVVSYLLTLHNGGAAADIRPQDRFDWNGTKLNVRRVPPGQRGVYRTLEVEAGVPN